MSRRTASRRGSAALAVVGFIVLGLLMAVTGYCVGRYVVYHYFNAGEAVLTPGESGDQTPGTGDGGQDGGGGEATVPPEGGGTSDQSRDDSGEADTSDGDGPQLAALGFSRLQVGAFSTMESARSFAGELRLVGLPACAVPGDTYRVLAGAFREESAARLYAATVKAQGYEVFVGSWKLPAGTVGGSGDDAYRRTLAAVLGDMGVLATDLARLADSAVIGDTTSVGSRTGQLEGAVQTLAARLNATQPPSSWEQVHSTTTAALSRCGQAVRAFREWADGDRSSFAPALEALLNYLVDLEAARAAAGSPEG